MKNKVKTLSDYLFEGKNLAFFKCKCGNKIFVDDLYNEFEDPKYQSIIEEKVDDSFNSLLDDGLKDPDKNIAETFISVNYLCSECGNNLKIELLCEFEFSHEDEKVTTYLAEIKHYFIVDSNNSEIGTLDGIFFGKDILSTIRWFIFRWSIISNKIYIVSPFLDLENINFLISLQENIGDSIRSKCEISNIISRKVMNNGKYFNLETNLKEKLNSLKKEYCLDDVYSYCYDCDNYTFCERRRLGTFFSKMKFVEFKNNFHAKLYGGIINDDCETIITSFNLLSSELKQKESFTLIHMNSSEVESQISNLYGN